MKELSFKTNARHIGQLGRELVTDFVTALVELIKNAYDADAASARISIQDTKNGLGQIIVADCGSGMTAEDFENKWMVIGTRNKLSDPYTPKGRKKAGKKGIGRFSVERLAERVTIFSFPEQGEPFSVEIDWNRFEELDLLAIKQRLEILTQRQDREAAKFISSQLQYLIMLPSLDQSEKELVEAGINGNIRDYKSFYIPENITYIQEKIIPFLEVHEWRHQLVEDIKTPLTPIISPESCAAYQLLRDLCKKAGKNSISGIVLSLDGLRDEWTQRSIDKLQKELCLLVAPNFLEEDPFEIDFVAPEFKIDEMTSVNTIIDTHFAKINAFISADGRTGQAVYKDRTGATKTRDFAYETPLLCGNVTFELFYFLRDAEHMKLGGYNFRFASKVLDTYCGIKIYRDKFRVKPYGESGNDWLFLDKEKVKDTHGYLVGNNQTIGRINISDEHNPLLIDATNREGIIENEAFEQLRTFAKACIALISEVRKEAYEEGEKERKKLEEEKKKLEQKKLALSETHGEVFNMLGNIMGAAKSEEMHPGVVTMLETFATTLETHVKKQQEYQEKYEENAEKRVKLVQDSLDYAVSELTTYKNLASLGMLASEFGHETSDILNRVKTSVHAVIRNIRKIEGLDSSVALLDVVKKDFRRISSYSEMIIAFLRKKKREPNEKLSLGEVMNEVCGFYRDILEEFNISFSFACEDGIILNMRQIDLESVIINLITNAYAQLKVCTNRELSIRAWKEQDTIKLLVEDSGPGVPVHERETIFKAFVSTKDDGIGLGLNIVRDIVTSYGGTIVCRDSAALGGACFDVSFVTGDEVNAS